MTVKRPDSSCLTNGQRHGLRDPFSVLLGRGWTANAIPFSEFDNLAVILSLSGYTTMIVPICVGITWGLDRILILGL